MNGGASLVCVLKKYDLLVVCGDLDCDLPKKYDLQIVYEVYEKISPNLKCYRLF